MNAHDITHAIRMGNWPVAVIAGMALAFWITREIYGLLKKDKPSAALIGTEVRAWREILDITASLSRHQEHIAHLLEKMQQASQFEHREIRDSLKRVESQMMRREAQ